LLVMGSILWLSRIGFGIDRGLTCTICGGKIILDPSGHGTIRDPSGE
jgi:hypothetical protein